MQWFDSSLLHQTVWSSERTLKIVPLHKDNNLPTLQTEFSVFHEHWCYVNQVFISLRPERSLVILDIKNKTKKLGNNTDLPYKEDISRSKWKNMDCLTTSIFTCVPCICFFFPSLHNPLKTILLNNSYCYMRKGEKTLSHWSLVIAAVT